MKKKQNPLKNLQRERFCVLYASDREFFGNGVQSYIEAYDIDVMKKGQYKVAQVLASKLLLNVIILRRIDEILDDTGLNDPFVDKQLKIILTQNSNLSAKIKAINEYSKLKGRHKPVKVEHTGPEGQPIQINIINFKDASKPKVHV